MFEFQITAKNDRARTGIFSTPHGELQTPVFAPVGTQATVKTLTPEHLKGINASLVLSNTYHLYLRPGDELVRDMGGLHKFMQWPNPMLTDSGGFQVFSLSGTRKIDDEGVTFKSHIDGSTHRFTPEKSIAIQENLGADIIMAFDECSDPNDLAYSKIAMDRTHRWAERSLKAKTRADQALFGIVQGGVNPDLRTESAIFISSLDTPGVAIGGLSVGETKEEMHNTLDVVLPILPSQVLINPVLENEHLDLHRHDRPQRQCEHGAHEGSGPVQSAHDFAVEKKNKHRPGHGNPERPGTGKIQSRQRVVPVSYTHLTLPTNREV